MSVGVVLTTYGEPERNSFAEQWIYSYRILERLTRKIAPIPKPILPIIATARARGRVKLWSQHGFSSPMEPLHEKTVSALSAEFARRGLDSDLLVTKAYEFRRPGLRDALRTLTAAGCRRAVVVPMYVAAGDFTNGMTELALDVALRAERAWSRDRITILPLAPDETTMRRLVRTLADHFLASLERAGIGLPAQDWGVMLAAHGTVTNPPPGVNNGLLDFGRVLLELKRELKPHAGLVRVGWLNHTRGGRWTTPDVPTALREMQKRGIRKLVYFPWGFTTDNAETALEGRIALQELETPFERVEYLHCLNDSPALVELLADRVVSTLNGSLRPNIAMA